MSRLTRVLIRHFTHTRLSLFIACFPKHFWFYLTSNWPDPLSLATTNGVSVDILSSGYLDVSVRQVCFLYLCIQYKMPLKRRVSPFGNPRIKVYSQLPRAYRSVSRPSSPLDAKASTKCTFIAWIIICTEINLFIDKNSLCDGLLNYIKQHWIWLLGWWRWTGSNRWPPACKAGALPTELHPLNKKTAKNMPFWWARVDLNYRPHAYQACALTTWATSP